jgi:hypothetical protein
VIIAVAVVLVVQMTIDEVIDVIPVGDSRVAAIRSVYVPGFVTTANVPARASCRVCSGDFDRVLFDLSSGCRMVKVPIVQVIHMSVVLDGGMAAALAVHMVVVVMMIVVCRHIGCSPL